MNPLIFPLLQLLSDGCFHSGAAMARHFNVSRTTIWNALKEAQNQGVEIFSVRGRGYRLPAPVRLLDHATVLAAIGPQRDRFTLQLHRQLESTNSQLMQLAAQGAAHGSCVAADLQTQGRGRRGRSWQTGLGSSLTFSLLWRFQSGAAALSGLSLAVGVAMMRTLDTLGVQGVGLKWPNDLVARQQGRVHKLAGVLIELQGDMEGPSAAIIGIGVNLRLPEQVRQRIDQPATDLASLGEPNCDPSRLLGRLLHHLADVLERFEHRGFAALRNEWTARHAYQDRPVLMLPPDGSTLRGIARGVADDGALLVETAEGVRRFVAGEVSLREVPA